MRFSQKFSLLCLSIVAASGCMQTNSFACFGQQLGSTTTPALTASLAEEHASAFVDTFLSFKAPLNGDQQDKLLSEIEVIDSDLTASTRVANAASAAGHPVNDTTASYSNDSANSAKKLKKKLDKKVNKLNALFESGKIFKLDIHPDASFNNTDRVKTSKLMEKTLDKALKLEKNPVASKFLAKMQSGMDSFYNRVLTNPSTRSTIESFLNGTRSSPMMDRVLSPDQKASMLKDITDVAAVGEERAVLVKRGWHHHHSGLAVSIGIFILLIILLGPFGLFLPMIILGAIGFVFLVSLLASLIAGPFVSHDTVVVVHHHGHGHHY